MATRAGAIFSLLVFGLAGCGTSVPAGLPCRAVSGSVTYTLDNEQAANGETLPVTVAAQDVQRSADPDAYAQWEGESRVLAQALTGEVPASFACRTDPPATPVQPVALAAALAADAGPPALPPPVGAARGWLVAGWLIGHADQYGVTTVTFAGQRWSGRKGTWTAHSPATDIVEINQ